MSIMNSTKTQDRNNEHDGFHKSTIVSVLCFCGVHHDHCFCLVFLWSPSCSLFLSCGFLESIMLIVSVLCFCGVHPMSMMDSTKTQDRNNDHDGLHKNTRQKQWSRWTPQKHKTETMSMMDFTKTPSCSLFLSCVLWSSSCSLFLSCVFVESIMIIVSVLCFCGIHHAHCFCLDKNTRQKQWAWWIPQKHKTETMIMMDSTKIQDRNNDHDGLHKNTRQKQWAWWISQKHKTETMSMIHCFSLVFLWSPSWSLFLSCVFVESIMLIVSVLCFCGVHHAHCFCLVFLWSPSWSLFLSCVFVEFIMIIDSTKHKTETMSMMNSTKHKTETMSMIHSTKNTRQKQWSWWTPQKHKTEIMSMMDSTKT
jgi:hypothetical protein